MLDSALSQFPIIGTQLGRPEGLSGSTTTIVIGSVVALYGAMGLGQAVQNAANIAWSVPRNSRANPIILRLRSIIFLAISGAGILALAIATSVFANPERGRRGSRGDPAMGHPLVGFALTLVIFVSVFRLISHGRAGWRSVLPGAVVAAMLWQALQWIGNTYVREVIVKADGNQMNETFALVLGLIAFIFVAAVMVVLGLEVNVVAAPPPLAARTADPVHRQRGADQGRPEGVRVLREIAAAQRVSVRRGHV